jgi:hypothetical protein
VNLCQRTRGLVKAGCGSCSPSAAAPGTWPAPAPAGLLSSAPWRRPDRKERYDWKPHGGAQEQRLPILPQKGERFGHRRIVNDTAPVRLGVHTRIYLSPGNCLYVPHRQGDPELGWRVRLCLMRGTALGSSRHSPDTRPPAPGKQLFPLLSGHSPPSVSIGSRGL